MIYKVWDPFQSSSFYADEIIAEDPAEAGELFAENDHDNGNYEGGDYELKVMDPEGIVVDVTVSVDWTANFYGRVQE